MPVVLNCTVTACNMTDGTMPETEQLLPSTNGDDDLPRNEAGSIDVWFGSKTPDCVLARAFRLTVPCLNSSPMPGLDLNTTGAACHNVPVPDKFFRAFADRLSRRRSVFPKQMKHAHIWRSEW